jgi:hypothetical protein
MAINSNDEDSNESDELASNIYQAQPLPPPPPLQLQRRR